MMNNQEAQLATPQKEVEGSLNPISGTKSIHDESAEKFKQNEKNLKEERLRKESKMDISLGVENNLKMLKANTPGQAGPGEAVVHDGDDIFGPVGDGDGMGGCEYVQTTAVIPV